MAELTMQSKKKELLEGLQKRPQNEKKKTYRLIFKLLMIML